MPGVTYEVLEGYVQGGNDGGFKIQERWVNYDQRSEVRHPKPGEQVKIRVRNGRYIVALVNPDEELPPEPEPRRAGGAWRDPAEERRSVRQSALMASVAWLTQFSPDGEHKPTSDHVLRLAEKFETWVYRT
jgi:hypothetical protein